MEIRTSAYKPLFIPKTQPLRTSTYSTRRIGNRLNVHTVTKFGINVIDEVIQDNVYNNQDYVNVYDLSKKNKLVKWYMQNKNPTTKKHHATTTLTKSGSSVILQSNATTHPKVNKPDNKNIKKSNQQEPQIDFETLGMLQEAELHYGPEKAQELKKKVLEAHDDTASVYDMDSASVAGTDDDHNDTTGRSPPHVGTRLNKKPSTQQQRNSFPETLKSYKSHLERATRAKQDEIRRTFVPRDNLRGTGCTVWEVPVKKKNLYDRLLTSYPGVIN